MADQQAPPSALMAPDGTQQLPATGPVTTRRGLILLGCAVLGSGLGVGAQRLTAGSGTAPAVVARTPAPPAPTPLTATITSFDPSRGASGFRLQNKAWRSQHYTTAAFGGLKDGIGLQLDLGSARALRSVVVDVQEGPLTLELRSADAAGHALADFTRVGSPVSGNDTVTLPVTGGGSHRFWLVWVTALASSQGQFAAVIGSVTPKG